MHAQTQSEKSMDIHIHTYTSAHAHTVDFHHFAYYSTITTKWKLV